MPITARDLKGSPKPVQRNIASLIGGFVIAIGSFILWNLVASQIAGGMPSVPVIVLGAAVALAIGIWIRLADL
jgi:hypothetical protein